MNTLKPNRSFTTLCSFVYRYIQYYIHITVQVSLHRSHEFARTTASKRTDELEVEIVDKLYEAYSSGSTSGRSPTEQLFGCVTCASTEYQVDVYGIVDVDGDGVDFVCFTFVTVQQSSNQLTIMTMMTMCHWCHTRTASTIRLQSLFCNAKIGRRWQWLLLRTTITTTADCSSLALSLWLLWNFVVLHICWAIDDQLFPF